MILNDNQNNQIQVFLYIFGELYNLASKQSSKNSQVLSMKLNL